MICRMGDLTKDDVGAIRVQPSHTFVEILATSADKFTNALGPDMKVEDGAVVTKLDKAPDLSRGPKPGGRGPKPNRGGPRSDSGPRSDRGPRPDRAPYDPDAPRAPRKPRAASTEEASVAYDKPRGPRPDKGFDKPRGDKPKFDKPKAPKGERPPKSHKTERSPMKPGATPKPKSAGKPDSFDKPGGKPKAKAVWKKEKPADRGADRPRGDGKPADKPFKARAADPSKRFVPPGKLGAKPKGGKPSGKAGGGDAAPKRGKSSFRPK